MSRTGELTDARHGLFIKSARLRHTLYADLAAFLRCHQLFCTVIIFLSRDQRERSI
jgi:hypothetical protein